MKNKILKAPEQQLLHWILCQMQAKRSGILDYGVNICRICTQIVPSPTWTDCCRYSKCHHWCVGSCALPGGPFRVIWEKKKTSKRLPGRGPVPVFVFCFCPYFCTSWLRMHWAPWSPYIHEISLHPSMLKQRVLKHQKFCPITSLAVQKWGCVYIYFLLDSKHKMYSVALCNLTCPPLCKIYSFKS